MASNSFGTIFKITTWGESHGKAVGVVIDGCPAGLALSEAMINEELAKRAPGLSSLTSPRKEPDQAEIYSGIFEGQTTGAPILILIPNRDIDSSPYEKIKHLMRPGHANFTYLEKYGVFDYRGGGRSSARETAGRVAAGAVAKQILAAQKIDVKAYITQIGDVAASHYSFEKLQTSPVRCPDPKASQEMVSVLEKTMEAGDSLGGVIEFVIKGVPAGLGEPIYEKLEANLAKAMLSLPATKGFEIGEGFAACSLKGSEHNDAFQSSDDMTTPATNHAGGTLGGISTGMPIVGRVAFKPTSSIKIPQRTVTDKGKETSFQLPQNARQDPCVAIRAVPIVEAMAALVIADAWLMNRSARVL